MTFDNMTTINSYGYTIWFAYIMYLVDFVLLMLIALYLDNVMPTPGGVRKSWYYFLTTNYWFPRIPPPQNPGEELKESLTEDTYQEIDQNYEPVGVELRLQKSHGRTVEIRGLRKVFDDIPAVDDLNVDMYSGQIFALLGHNGAGKTTMISMLTGMLVPTGGSATAFNIDVFHNLIGLRRDLGVCTQHDSYFEQLTVMEHFEFFGMIRGLSNRQIRSESRKLMKDLKLAGEKNTLAKNLSGGNKRKLSMALAFLGKPRLVLLDEPTSGMDATTRRELWDIMAEYKRDRIIILTTHYMDEADTLGDRIGIMARGKLVCCGSSMFLKKKYGIGYNLHVIMQSAEASKQKIQSFITNYISQAETGLITGEEIEFKLPFFESSKFKGMFEEMDNRMGELEIKSYGISVSTLEDVFIKVGEQEEQVDQVDQVDQVERVEQVEKLKEDGDLETKDTHKKDELVGETSIYSLADNLDLKRLGQYIAALKKKFKETVRNINVFGCSVIFPVFFVWFGIFGIRAFLTVREHTYSLLKDYGKTPIFVNNDSSMKSDHIKWLESHQDSSGFKLHVVNSTRVNNISKDVNNFANSIHNKKKGLDPYVYGSYYLHTHDTNKNVSVVFLFNLTNPQSLFAFSGEFINMLLKNIVGDNTYQVKTTLTQISLPSFFEQFINDTGTVLQFMSSFALGFAVITGLVASFIVREYENELKAHLLLAGLPVEIYWMSYLLIDLANFYIPIGGTIAIYKIMDMNVLFSFNQ